MTDILVGFLPGMRPGGDCVINIGGEIYRDGRRTPLQAMLVESMRRTDWEYRNLLMWDRRNLINGTGIFGWPKTYVSLAGTFEFLIHFRKPLTFRD